MSNTDGYDEPLHANEFGFTDKSIRHGFVRKVYLILTGQLVVTFGIVALFVLHDGVKMYVRQNMWMFWTAFAVTIVCIIALSCCSKLRRKFPHNFIFLGIFTCCEGFVMGAVSAQYSIDEVLIAIGITFSVVIGLTIFAFQTKYDFTMCSGFVMVSFMVLFIFGILAAIFRSKILSIVYSSVGALLFCFYLVYDTQMMMGGNHKHSISPEEYIFASLTLYLDVVNIFLYVLSLVGAAKD